MMMNRLRLTAARSLAVSMRAAPAPARAFAQPRVAVAQLRPLGHARFLRWVCAASCLHATPACVARERNFLALYSTQVVGSVRVCLRAVSPYG